MFVTLGNVWQENNYSCAKCNLSILPMGCVVYSTARVLVKQKQNKKHTNMASQSLLQNVCEYLHFFKVGCETHAC